LGALGKNSSLSGRTGIWQFAGNEIAQHPLFGQGFGATLSEDFRARLKGVFQVEYTHNQYLDVLVNTGIVGLALYGVMIGVAAYAAWRTYGSDRIAAGRNLLTVLLAGWAISAWSETSVGPLALSFFAAIFGLWGVATHAQQLEFVRKRARSAAKPRSAAD
jgi:O-antigen ligase